MPIASALTCHLCDTELTHANGFRTCPHCDACPLDADQCRLCAKVARADVAA